MEKTLSDPRGVRFAPSPTGRFHVGNLRTAWSSRELAHAWKQPWIVRFEDIDGPRVLAGAQEAQLADMAVLGLVPDELIIQSAAHARHWEVFGRGLQAGRIYPCFCSRRNVRDALDGAASAPHPRIGDSPEFVYSGHCRHLSHPPAVSEHGLPSLAWRFAVEEDPSGRADFIVARTSPLLPADPASFVPAYHLACAIDDWDGGYHTLVRAADLASVIPQHRAIMRWLAASEHKPYLPPAVFHTALVTQDDGHRLEKRTRGVTLAELRAAGLSPLLVVEWFRKSWDASLAQAWMPGKVFGEAASAVTLSALGLKDPA